MVLTFILLLKLEMFLFFRIKEMEAKQEREQVTCRKVIIIIQNLYASDLQVLFLFQATKKEQDEKV